MLASTLLASDLPAGMTQLWIIVAYLAALILLGIASNTVFRGTAVDYFVASRGVGPILLVLSVFGTTMTAFAIQGSSGEAWYSGVGIYGKMASWSGIVHAACFFLIGVKLWAFGKRFGYQTQIQFFRDRLESNNIGAVLFPILVLLQMPYIIVGILGSGKMIGVATAGAFPTFFPSPDNPQLVGAVPFWLGTLLATGVVWLYVWLGGARATAWANALQTIIFLVVGVVTFLFIADKLGGAETATRRVQELNPSKLTRSVTPEHEAIYKQRMAEWSAWKASTQPASSATATAAADKPSTKPAAAAPAVLRPHKPSAMSELEFFSYGFIPLSVAMFPHLFQLWLTARSAKAFRLTVTLHPILVMMIWAPCIAIGVWATAAVVGGRPVVPFTNESPGADPNIVLGLMVKMLGDPIVGGLLAAGVLAAILGGMDAQFLSIGSMFTHDIVDHYRRHDSMTDGQRLFTGRVFVILVVLASWLLTLVLQKVPIFTLAIWCFSGFAALFPLVFAALYWKRITKWGAYASILAGIGSGIGFYIYNGREHGFASRVEPEIWGVVPAAPMVIFAAIALVVVSLLTSPPSRATVDKFFSPRPAAE
ncbi:MAG: sodium:solute symporter family protein [Planctomycetes bacterium]|nr:sodium:solute symporter family protein [Planctomycetota bacterium]